MPPKRTTHKATGLPAMNSATAPDPAAAAATVAPRRSTRRPIPSATASDALAANPPAKATKRSSGKAKATSAVADTPTTTTTTTTIASKAKTPKSKTKRVLSDDEDGKVTSKKAKKDDADDAQSTETSKMVTVLKRGAAPADPFSSFVNTHQVYVSPDGEVWDGMLNQTNIGKNANKFYVLQLLHPINDASSCLLFVRWGRTGENGASQTKGPWAPGQAINEFKKQFRSKTGTAWEQRHGMVARPGKYTWLERDFETSGKDDRGEGASQDIGKNKVKDEVEPEKIPDSVLPSEVQNLCRIIFNTSFIDAALSSMNYDANKLPLGKLSKATILKGFAALKSLSEVIENAATAAQFNAFDNACSELSDQYYSIIPHVFGRNKPIVINTMPQLKKELELVDALGDMEIAQKLISERIVSDGVPINPIDARFNSLSLESMAPVAADSNEFAALASYARDTHGASHNYYTVKLETAFRVKRKFEDENWSNAGMNGLDEGQRLLLWHGSRSTNFAGILSQGLRIAPPQAPVNGYMFGKGVYFADSYNYCYAQSSGNIGILLLCDVAAKPCHELLSGNYNANEECKAANKLATKGLGQTQPVNWQDAGAALENDELKGCLMPKGAAENVNPPGAYLQYNEVIRYASHTG
ncbi:hypothetical protein EW145_g694 [Phellinidium pouzarii]|uniref:Poly [ADP-ribose] polymerase n=1 Tax=Phellinidium pouzarii TaxID=167371 RepID=A0A4S4LMX5_9AGAM|nr:hypothetical protein EW145_g694 [Phellinidium pouzarii]